MNVDFQWRLFTLGLFSSCALLPASPLQAQTTVAKDSPVVKNTTVVIPGIEYKRSGYHNFFWGKHYRKEWATPVRVNNFSLESAGLHPKREGGGRQSKSLWLEDANGKEYVLRSINKDFSRGLPEEASGTFVARVAKDQVSMGHPFSAITITPMAEAAGIFHTIPAVVYVPKQERLGEYNDEFGDQLYLFEVRPDEDQSKASNFGYSKNIIGSEKLFEKIYGDNDNQVDQLSFLRARLFDMFLGDWGRHPDNWRWAEFENGKQATYKPVPRDRDQAYTRIDGLYPNMAGALPGFRHIQGFGSSIKNTFAWNFPGRPLDKLFLNELPEDIWIQQAEDLKSTLTDSLIESSIRRMPPQVFEHSGREIIAKLKSRRDKLPDNARSYYRALAKKITLTGSDKTELIRINVLPRNWISIDMYKAGDSVAQKPFYSRTFNPAETKEIRLYSLDKQDILEIKGEQKSSIKVNVIDEKGNDSISIVDGNTRVRSVKFYRGNQFEYDTLGKKKFDFSFLPVITPKSYRAFAHDPLDLFPRTGLKVSAGVTYMPQPWRKEKYQVSHSIAASYGFLRGTFNAGYVGRWGSLIGNADLVVKGRVDAPAVENYFGMGNETENDQTVKNFYRTYSRRFYGGVGIEHNMEKKHHTELTLIYQSLRYQDKDDYYIGKVPSVNPDVFETKQFAGVEAGYSYDGTNGSLYPTKGIAIKLGGGALRNLSDSSYNFAKVNATVSGYIPLAREFTFAQRIGAATLFGEPDFYHYNRLGGQSELRGYERERFYGKHAVYSNSELRWLTSTRNWLFNGRAGLVAFYDVGRVWMPDEDSDRWHAGYGGGVILIPYNRVTLSATYGLTKREGGNLTLRADMFF